jgi:hypothetical protein
MGQRLFRPPVPENQKTSFLLHIIVRSLDIQNVESILKGARQKYEITLKGKPIRGTADFSTEL